MTLREKENRGIRALNKASQIAKEQGISEMTLDEIDTEKRNAMKKKKAINTRHALPLLLAALFLMLVMSGCQNDGQESGEAIGANDSASVNDSSLDNSEDMTATEEGDVEDEMTESALDDAADGMSDDGTKNSNDDSDMDGIIGEVERIDLEALIYSWHYTDELESPYLFTSTDSFYEFLDTKAMTEDDIALAKNLKESYGASFFEEQDLAVVYVPKHSSADSIHFVEATILPGNMLNVVLDEYCPGDNGEIETMDMDADLVILEVPKGFSEIISSRG